MSLTESFTVRDGELEHGRGKALELCGCLRPDGIGFFLVSQGGEMLMAKMSKLVDICELSQTLTGQCIIESGY